MVHSDMKSSLLAFLPIFVLQTSIAAHVGSVAANGCSLSKFLKFSPRPSKNIFHSFLKSTVNEHQQHYPGSEHSEERGIEIKDLYND